MDLQGWLTVISALTAAVVAIINARKTSKQMKLFHQALHRGLAEASRPKWISHDNKSQVP